MQELKLGVATSGFGLPLREGLRKAAAMHASGVLLDARYEIQGEDFTETARRQLLHSLKELGLGLVGFHYPLRRGLTDPRDLDRRVEALRRTMSLGSQFGCRMVTFRYGSLPDAEDIQGRVLFRQVLEDLASHGNHVGVVPMVTAGRDDLMRFLETLEEVQTGFIGVDLDPTLLLRRGEQVGELVRRLHDRIGHVQVKDAVKDLDGQIREVVLGRGEVDWISLLPTLSEIEYRGWLTVVRNAGSDSAGDCGRAIEYLRELSIGG